MENVILEGRLAIMFEELLVSQFGQVMEPVRAAGWWVALDYKPAGRSCIYANRLGHLNRRYAEVPFRSTPVLAVYVRWFTACAALLTQVASTSALTLRGPFQ